MGVLSVGILIVSDRCSRGEREDRCGPLLQSAVRARGWDAAALAVVSDEQDGIESCLRDWSGGPGAFDIVLTSGGTGLGPRDVTPEATRAVITREIPGLAERMRREGEKTTSMAVLSRAVCGTRGRTLILNLPGSPKGAEESLASIGDLLVHALHTMSGGDHP